MNDENWDDYRVLLALAHKGSVTGAARALGISETTVTRRLAHIEHVLDAHLFERKRGRVLPTAAMQRVIARIEHVRDEMQAVRSEAGGSNERLEGTVRVTTVQLIADQVIVPAMAAFHGTHPGLTLELLVDSAVLGIAHERVADIAIRGVRPASDPDAITRKLGTMAYGVYCHEDLVGAERTIPWIGYTGTTEGRVQANWIDARIREENSTALTRVSKSQTLTCCLLAGLGKSVIPVPAAARFPSLVRLECAVPLPEREFWMVLHPSFRDVRRIAVVSDWLAETVQDFLQAS